MTSTRVLLLISTLSQLCGAQDELVPAMMSAEEESHIPESPAVLSVAREQILSAQFECYLKIMSDPPRRDPGPYCNRTWDGWLCWGDSAPGTALQLCPAYFHDFDPTEKVSKVCDSDGQWFHHPVSNRLWTNYTQCSADTHHKREFILVNYYLVMVGHGLSIISLFISICIFSHFKC
ncbi:calcitonin gene-related peptide type 1 receptor-like [Carassius auratus]|uniref:Calcitonin gene-related peptide type 1 receptor-like n=1 Tax=Carassius auratus TaxID=7957 RepID=A0A6P6J841_CARAU|nr:calcitonin gene-related peptide type 1 receptor-like [Carassius auratus]